MAMAKSTLTKEMIHIFNLLYLAVTGKLLTDTDIRSACQAIGIAAVGQAELTKWLKELRDGVNDTPLTRLNILAGALPENMVLALVAIAQEHVNSRINTVYSESVLIGTKNQEQILALEEQASRLKKENDLKVYELGNMKQVVNEHKSTASTMNMRIRELEMENAKLEGRLVELENQAKKAQQELQAIKEAPAATEVSDKLADATSKPKRARTSRKASKKTAA